VHCWLGVPWSDEVILLGRLCLSRLSEYGNADSSVLFENNCAVMFERGGFLEFEDIRDDEDE
jgi:hypothetical protein